MGMLTVANRMPRSADLLAICRHQPTRMSTTIGIPMEASDLPSTRLTQGVTIAHFMLAVILATLRNCFQNLVPALVITIVDLHARARTSTPAIPSTGAVSRDTILGTPPTLDGGREIAVVVPTRRDSHRDGGMAPHDDNGRATNLAVPAPEKVR